MTTGDWFWSSDHNQLCRIIEIQTLWGETNCRVWLPTQDVIIKIRADRLKPLTEVNIGTSDFITYVAAGARIADALTHDVLLAPIESSVIPLPHQIKALSKAMSNDRIRYLLADEVGLGKTIEAGLIMRELKLRGQVKRTLIIAPKGLLTQWIAEMRTHFGEEFSLLIPSDIPVYRRILKEQNIWQSYNQIICPIDSVKPIDSRRGWEKERIAEYNKERFEDLISAGWDLIIVDEAHRLGGSTDQVARYQLGQALAEASPYLLLLSATPHQGKTDSFYRLISLLDPKAFPDINSVTKERVQPYVIRNEKRQAITVEGKPLFKPRYTQLIPISWEVRHKEQKFLYEAVTDYVRNGYNQARSEKKNYIGFLLILLQRLVSSSTQAILTTLERRLEALSIPEEQLTLFSISEDEWNDLDGQEQIETLIGTDLKALKNERDEVKLLLQAAKRCQETGPDAKAEALLEWIYRLQQEEGDPELKLLVFTEFIPTQEMLYKFLTKRGFDVVCLNGSMDMEERLKAQEAFAKEARILISTDAGGEGLNLQFCHTVINYDIPWNPMRLEQRIGRVDRIGQKHPVRALNFVFNNTVEYRVRQVLEEKLAVILKEFGIDKTGDVLDSAQSNKIFDNLYIEAILNPDAIESTVDKIVGQIQEQAEKAKQNVSLIQVPEDLEPSETQRLISHPLPHWVELMTTSYLRSHGGKANKQGQLWNLLWPNGKTDPNVIFTGKDAEEISTAKKLTLEDPRIRGLVMRLPYFAEGQPIPFIKMPGLTYEVKGVWSLWRISIYSDDWNKQSIMPLFLHDDGRILMPTARHIWDQLITAPLKIEEYLSGTDAKVTFSKVLNIAEVQGKNIYDELLQIHRNKLAKEREKEEYIFSARRRIIERIGLPAVRSHRLALLEREKCEWEENLKRKFEVSPEMVPLLILRIEGVTQNE